LLLICHIIKKARPQEKSRFVHQLILEGYNCFFFFNLQPFVLLLKISLLFPMAVGNGADQTGYYAPIQPELLSKADVR